MLSLYIYSPLFKFLIPNLFFFSIIFVIFQECCINGIMHYITFEDWLFKKFSIIFLKSIQVACINSSFLFILSSILWYRCTTVCLTIYPLMDIKDICFSSSFWLLKIKLLWTFYFYCEHFCTGFCVNLSFYFSEINTVAPAPLVEKSTLQWTAFIPLGKNHLNTVGCL